MPRYNPDEFFSVNGKVAIVVGAARGIGNEIANLFARSGGKVFMADNDETELKRRYGVLKEEGKDVDFFVVDIRKEEELKKLGKEAIRRYGRVDAVYITPGINIRKKFLDYTEEDFDRVIELNLKGNFLAMKTLAKLMLNNKNGGSIVVLSSIRSQVVEPGQSAYAATKAGIIQMVRGLASEVGQYNIRVNAIAAGVVDTELTAPIKQDEEWYKAYRDRSILRRWASVEEIAGPAVFLATEAASYIDASVLFVDGGWTAIDGRFEPKL